jgi:hypothetical protein
MAFVRLVVQSFPEWCTDPVHCPMPVKMAPPNIFLSHPSPPCVPDGLSFNHVSTIACHGATLSCEQVCCPAACPVTPAARVRARLGVLPAPGATLKPELPRSYRPSALGGATGFVGGAGAMKTGPKNAGGVRSERPPLHSKVSLFACT